MSINYPLAIYRFQEIVLSVRWASSLKEGIPRIVAQAIATRANQAGWLDETKVSTCPSSIHWYQQITPDHTNYPFIVDGFPVFVKVPASAELITNVQEGTPPAEFTTVETFSLVPLPADVLAGGMCDLHSRRSVIESMLAFKQFVSD